MPGRFPMEASGKVESFKNRNFETTLSFVWWRHSRLSSKIFGVSLHSRYLGAERKWRLSKLKFIFHKKLRHLKIKISRQVWPHLGDVTHRYRPTQSWNMGGSFTSNDFLPSFHLSSIKISVNQKSSFTASSTQSRWHHSRTTPTSIEIMSTNWKLYLSPQAVVSIAFWFESRRTFATGIGASGTGESEAFAQRRRHGLTFRFVLGLGTFLYAPFTNWLIESYGWRGNSINWTWMMM